MREPNAADDAVLEMIARERGLSEFPAILGQLPQLEQLDLSGNRLTALPDDIGNLSRLTRLMLDDNQLAALPESLGRLTSLRWLALDGNALTDRRLNGRQFQEFDCETGLRPGAEPDGWQHRRNAPRERSNRSPSRRDCGPTPAGRRP